jgi:hypothetical protein
MRLPALTPSPTIAAHGFSLENLLGLGQPTEPSLLR